MNGMPGLAPFAIDAQDEADFIKPFGVMTPSRTSPPRLVRLVRLVHTRDTQIGHYPLHLCVSKRRSGTSRPTKWIKSSDKTMILAALAVVSLSVGA